MQTGTLNFCALLFLLPQHFEGQCFRYVCCPRVSVVQSQIHLPIVEDTVSPEQLRPLQYAFSRTENNSIEKDLLCDLLSPHHSPLLDLHDDGVFTGNMASRSVGELQEMEVDRKGESEESGDDETKRKSINGNVDPNQPATTGKEESPVDMDTITLDPEEEDVDLVHCRIGNIEGLEVLQKCKTLSLRQNLIKKIENLDSLRSLRELDLYDNQIRKLENLQNLTEIEKVEGLEQLTQLKKLFLLHNKIGNIANLDHLTGLDMLELGSNRIRILENLDTLSSLQSLFLGTNKITTLQNLDGLHNLTVLSIQSNRITKIEGLQNLLNLRELYLSHNGIEVIEGLENNKKLTTLDIAANRVKKIENINHLTDLQEFWMNDNQIDNWSDLDELKNAKSLETVYLERNPVQKDPQYRRKIMLALPSVRQIDATFIRF
ncbi:hypothetical protein F7725_011447 [Dissostichus mawsoni]|uniref:Protein phosphatase 1 regulatory subunit 7 n=1 Tax=Dissostichus mawsoni TaxID=36200 RepID=A0A7J5Z984_DISMA|nr:hypothetical protein F7725_011447 [Dissostichus mawsoni]